MRRRDFLTVLGGGVFVTRYGRWYREASGLFVPRPRWVVLRIDEQEFARHRYDEAMVIQEYVPRTGILTYAIETTYGPVDGGSVHAVCSGQSFHLSDIRLEIA